MILKEIYDSKYEIFIEKCKDFIIGLRDEKDLEKIMADLDKI